MEPIEEVVIDVPTEYLSGYLPKLRKRIMQNMEDIIAILHHLILPYRGLIGFRSISSHGSTPSGYELHTRVKFHSVKMEL